MTSMKSSSQCANAGRRHIDMAAALALLSVVTIAPGAARAAPADNPLTALSGSWAGTGTIEMKSGAKERIRCQASYRLENAVNLRLEMNCSSDSYKFELRSRIAYDDDHTISGSWNETTRGVGGNLSGRAGGAQIQARAESQAFTALLDMTTRGNRQTVSIQSPGSEMSGVSIVLTRGAR